MFVLLSNTCIDQDIGICQDKKEFHILFPKRSMLLLYAWSSIITIPMFFCKTMDIVHSNKEIHVPIRPYKVVEVIAIQNVKFPKSYR